MQGVLSAETLMPIGMVVALSGAIASWAVTTYKVNQLAKKIDQNDSHEKRISVLEVLMPTLKESIQRIEEKQDEILKELRKR
jgi:cAMP phosphodiesterase